MTFFLKKYYAIPFLTLTLLLPALGNAQVRRYDSNATREVLLQLRKNPPSSPLLVQGKYSSTKAEAFVEFYQKNIWPFLDAEHKQVLAYYSISLLVDSGSYESEEELKALQEELQLIIQKLNEMEVDPKWKETLKTAVKLSEGLSGDLVTEVNDLLYYKEIYSFDESMEEHLNTIDRLQKEFELATNQAPSNRTLAEILQSNSQASREFKNGKISLAEAQKILTDNYKKGGYKNIAFEAIQKHPDHLNQVAVLRSQLAKSKGHATWAAYRLSNDKGYTDEFRGTEKQKAFLKDLITSLAPEMNKIISLRAQVLKVKDSELRSQLIGLLLPLGLSQMTPYFPAENITEIWEEIILESGFSKEALDQILVDAELRDKKNTTEAYMAGVLAPYTEKTVLNAKTLNYENPPKNSSLWKPGLSYILQSYKIGGVGDLEVMFHEGGHALEKIFKYKTKITQEAYAYVETPSMTMEHFTRDPLLLLEKAKPVDGEKPSLDEIKLLVERSQIGQLYGLLSSAGMSLFDIELWDYDYDQPDAMTFLERVELLHKAINKMTLEKPSLDSDVPTFYALLATGHFYGGQVRNVGYVFAEMSSMQMAEFIYDEIERTSGKRTWLNQPGLAPLFTEAFFAEGWKLPFPENIEKITGRKYDPKKIVENLLNNLSNCQSLLK